jgi:hypothetical protein
MIMARGESKNPIRALEFIRHAAHVVVRFERLLKSLVRLLALYWINAPASNGQRDAPNPKVVALAVLPGIGQDMMQLPRG